MRERSVSSYPVHREQPVSLAEAAAGSVGAEVGPPRSAQICLVVSSSLCTQAPSRQAHIDVSAMLGRKPLFLAGVGVFALGSALCGTAPSLGALIAARCFQG